MISFIPKQIFQTVMLISLVCSNNALADSTKIKCDSQPKNGIQNLYYETVWEQSAESEDFLIPSIVDAAYDHSGNICVVNYQQKNLVIFEKDGSYLRTLGRSGEGPGELDDARKVFFDGDRYGLLQVFPGAIVWLNTDGTPAGKIQIGNSDSNSEAFISVAHALQDGPNIYAWTNQLSRSDEGEILEDINIYTIGADGSLDQLLYKRPEGENSNEGGGINEGKVYDIWLRRWTLDGNGGVWVASERDEYLLQHWDSKGELVLEVTREYELVARTKKGTQGIKTWFMGRGWTENQIKVGKTAPVVKSLHLGENGNIWVRLDRGGKSENSDLLAVYDVISQEGEYLKQVIFHLAQDYDSWRMLDETTALIITTDLDEEEQMIILLKAGD